METYNCDTTPKIVTFQNDTVSYRIYNVLVLAGTDAGDGIYMRPYIIDLTEMFGSGNEPTSTDDQRIAWIEAYATAHPEYNGG